MLSVARIHNSQGDHRAEVAAGKHAVSVQIAPKASGFGSSVSGGEMLMLALATCYCNDIYREAAKTGIEVTAVDVECSADFPAEGAPASGITYTARISAKATAEQIRDLASRTDSLAEIQNTVRAAIPVTLGGVEPQSV